MDVVNHIRDHLPSGSFKPSDINDQFTVDDMIQTINKDSVSGDDGDAAPGTGSPIDEEHTLGKSEERQWTRSFQQLDDTSDVLADESLSASKVRHEGVGRGPIEPTVASFTAVSGTLDATTTRSFGGAIPKCRSPENGPSATNNDPSAIPISPDSSIDMDGQELGRRPSAMDEILSSKRVLITGATGFVGLRTVSKLLGSTRVREVIAAVRAETNKQAWKRMKERIQKHPTLGIQSHMGRLNVIHYDGSTIPVLPQCDALLNLAADTSWDKPLEEMMQANYHPLAQMIDNASVPSNVVHCSTAYARPMEHVQQSCVAKEGTLPQGSTFFCPYAESKYQLERKIEEEARMGSNTCYSIVRPAAVGGSIGLDGVMRGWVTNFKSTAGFYLLTHPDLPFAEELGVAPAVGHYPSNIIPVDFVSNTLIVALYENFVRSSSPSNTISYYHVSPDGNKDNPRYDDVIHAYNKNLHIEYSPKSELFNRAGERTAWYAGQLYLVTSVPFLFESKKHKECSSLLLTAEDQCQFPMGWNHLDDDDVLAYVKDCADVVALGRNAGKA